MLNNRFFRVSSQGIVVYNDKYFGSQASFNSYIEGFETYQLEEDQREEIIITAEVENSSKSDLNESISKKNLENSSISRSHNKEVPTNNVSTKLSRQALQNLQELGKGNNLEKFLEAHGFRDSTKFSVPELKEAFEKFISKQEEDKQNNEISKWANQIEDLRALRNDKELEKWLESKGLPAANVSIPAVQKGLQKYFQNMDDKKKTIGPKIGQPIWGKRLGNKGSGDSKVLAATSHEKLAAVVKMKEVSKIRESLDLDVNGNNRPIKRVARDFGPCMKVEEFNGRSILLREETLANKLWEDFKSMSTPKKIAVVVGITVVTAALGFVSWQILLLAFPSVLQVNRYYWTEVLAQWFIQRQESTFHLLQHTAQNAKPLSTAWANQYLLWKYI